MTTKSDLSFIGVTITSTLGSVIGAIVLYGVGAWIGERNLYRFVNRYGKFLRVKTKDIDRTINWFEKYGYWTIFFCRFVPLLKFNFYPSRFNSNEHTFVYFVYYAWYPDLEYGADLFRTSCGRKLACNCLLHGYLF